MYPFNPNTGKTIAGSLNKTPALDMAFIAHWSKTPLVASGNTLIAQQALPSAGTTTVDLSVAKNEVQSLAIGGATGGSFNFKFNGENYAGGTNAVYHVDIGAAVGGTFTLTFYGQTTATIAYNADPTTGGSSVRAKLEALTTIGTGNVTVTGTGSTIDPYVITFVNDLGSVPLTLTGSGASLTVSGPLTVASATTGVGILYTVTATQLKTALVSLAGIGSSDVTVTGSVAGPFAITFTGALAGVGQPLITIPKDVTTGGTGVVVTRTTHGTAQPDVARIVTVVANVSGVTGNVVVNGRDLNNDVIADTIALNGLTPVLGVKAFKSISSVVFPTRVHSGDTVDVGIGSALGLHHRLPHNTVLRAELGNVLEGTAPTVVVSAATLSLNVFTLNTTLDGTQVDAYYIV